MKNFLVALLVFFAISSVAQEEKKNPIKPYTQYQKSYAGLGLAFNEYVEELGLQIRAKSDFLNSRFSSAFYFTLYNNKSIDATASNNVGNIVRVNADYNAYEFMIDMHYNIVYKSFRVYPLVGVGILYETIEVDAEDNNERITIDDSNVEFAAKGGLGFQYELLYGITVFCEPHAVFYSTTGAWIGFQGGLMYAF